MFQHLDIMEKDLLNRLEPTGGDAKSQKLTSHSALTDLHPEAKKIFEGIRSRR